MRFYKKTALLLAVLILVSVFPVFGRVSKAADYGFVRVKLSTEGAEKIKMSVKGTYILTEANRAFTDGTLTVTGSGNTVSVSHSSEGELYSGRTVTLERVDLGKDAGYLRFSGKYGTRYYLGHFSITASNGVLTVVNRVPMTHYLYGVVGHEMSNSFPVEALKAQAVAAKCYALLSLKSSGSYDIGDTSSDQVYKGYTSSYQNVIAACDAVSDVALYDQGRVMICYYAASNGGYMLKPSSVWTGRSDYDAAYSEGVDEYDMKNPNSPRELIKIPAGFFPDTAKPALYQLFLTKAVSAANDNRAIPAGYSFQSILSVDNVVSMDDNNRTTGVAHTKARIDMTLAAAIDHIPDPTATPEPTATPSPTPTATPTLEPTLTPEPTATPDPALTPDPNATPEPTPTATPEGWGDVEETPSPAPTDTPAPTNTPIPLTIEVPVSFTFNFSELEGLGLYSNTSLRVMYAIKTEDGFALQRCRYGHGVGMSQRGAEQMALEGLTYQQILAYYYGGAELGAMAVSSPEDAGVTAPAATPALTNTDATGTVVKSTVNLRESASTKSRTLSELAEGTPLKLTGLFGDWYQVSVPGSGMSGYCYGDYIEPSNNGVIARGYVNASAVNFRQGPGTGYDSVGKLSKKTDVGLYGFDGDWYSIYVTGTGQEGYILKRYVTVTDKAVGTGGTQGTITLTPSPTPTATPAGMTPSPTPEITPAPTATPTPIPTPAGPYTATGVVNGSRVNIREGASTSTTSFGKLDKGTKLGVYKKAGSWYSVVVLDSNQAGYIYGKYVTLNAENDASDTPSTASAGTINASRVNIRKGASTRYTSLGKLSKGTKLSVLSSSGSWYKVSITGTDKIGYVFSKYVTLASADSGAGRRTGVIAALVNLRTSPTVESGSKVLTTIPRGTVVTVHSKANGWCYITYNNTTGYCIASAVTIS